MRYKIKNWEKFQHYKDRKPLWIKLYRDILDSRDWAALSGIAAKTLIMVWLIGSEYDGTLPLNDVLAFRLRIKISDLEKCIQELIENEFIIESEEAPKSEKTTSKELKEKSGFGDRYVSQTTKNLIMIRDVNCITCGSSENLEIDHIKPVSKGGNSEPENLQLLCRSCNRSKRATYSAEQVATHLAQVATHYTSGENLRSLEKEIEKEIETEIETETEYSSELEASSKPAQPNYQPEIKFPTKGNPAEWVLPQSLFDDIQETFKDDPILNWIMKARLWAIANPKRRKTAKGMPTFLIGWMGRQNDRPAQQANYQTNGKSKPANLQEVLAKMPAGFVMPGEQKL